MTKRVHSEVQARLAPGGRPLQRKENRVSRQPVHMANDIGQGIKSEPAQEEERRVEGGLVGEG